MAAEDRGPGVRELRGDILGGRALTGQGAGKTHLVTRYDISNLVRDEILMYVRPDYWQSHIARLPNPPSPISHEDGLIRTEYNVPASILWWDGSVDLVLLQFPVFAGTGHTGRYDGDEPEPVFDTSRPSKDTTLSGGCVFVPTSALWFERSGAVLGDDTDSGDYRPLARYDSVRPYPALPDVCNLAQYGMPAKQIAAHLGISKQAVSLILKRLPQTLKSMTLILRRGEGASIGQFNLPQCQAPGCRQPAQTPRARFCAVHHALRGKEQGKYGVLGKEAGVLGGDTGRGKRQYTLKRSGVAAGTLDDFLPLPPLVDQTGET